MNDIFNGKFEMRMGEGGVYTRGEWGNEEYILDVDWGVSPFDEAHIIRENGSLNSIFHMGSGHAMTIGSVYGPNGPAYHTGGTVVEGFDTDNYCMLAIR